MAIAIRKAVFSDIPLMIDLGRRAHAASENAAFDFDEQGAKLLGAACMTQKAMCAFVAMEGEEVVGLLLGHEDKIPYAKLRYATDIVFFAERPGAGKALMERFIGWAFDERRVHQMLLGVTFGGKSAKSGSSFYRRMGFAQVGGLFVKTKIDCTSARVSCALEMEA